MRSETSVHKHIGMELTQQAVDQHLLASGGRGVITVHVYPGLVHDCIYQVVGLSQKPVFRRREKDPEVTDAVCMHGVSCCLPQEETGQDLLRSAKVEL